MQFLFPLDTYSPFTYTLLLLFYEDVEKLLEAYLVQHPVFSVVSQKSVHSYNKDHYVSGSSIQKLLNELT